MEMLMDFPARNHQLQPLLKPRLNRQIILLSLYREAQAKDVYMASVLETVRQGKLPGLTNLHGKIFFQKGVLCRRYKESVDSEPCIQMLIPSI